jgi:hypothetical protein
MSKATLYSKRSKPARILCKAVFPIYSLLVSLLLLECVLRVTHLFGASPMVTERDPLIGYRYIPGRQYAFQKESDHPITGRFNSYGWRDVDWNVRKPANGYRAAILGDSFVESFQVESDRTFLKLSEKKLSQRLGRPVELMNFGRSGFTQSEEYLVLQRSIAKFKPDIVALFLFPENDITDISPITAPMKMRPFYSLNENGGLVLDTSFRNMSEYRGKPISYFLKRNSALFSLVYQRRAIMKAGRNQPEQEDLPDGIIPSTHALEGYITLCTKHPDPQYVKNYRINKALIRAMSEFCRKRGIRFMLVDLDIEAYRPDIEQKWVAIDPTFDRNFYEDDLGRFAKSLGVDYLGLQRPFRTAYTRTRQPLHWEKQGHWGHWNYKGHELVADLLSNKLSTIIQEETRRKER